MAAVRPLPVIARTIRVAGLLLACTVLPACHANGGADTPPSRAAAVAANETPLTVLPAGTRWRLAHSEREALSLPEAARVTLQIDAGRLSGDSSCNQYSAGYTLQEGRITLQPIVATKRGCMAPVDAIERAWFEALRSLQWISRDGDALLLRLAAGDALRFVPAPPATE
jgi:heat shock protein HslJ